MSDLTGSIISHYRIDELLGAGGMGTVYRAYDLNLERPIALKLMHPQIANEPEFRERLKAEAKAAANLDHPSIIQIYNFGETADKKLYVAMEFIKDGSLRNHLQRILAQNGYLDLSLAIQIVVQMAEALYVAHTNDIVHRDVKPGNIILKRTPRAEEAGFAPFRAVLTDFGLVQNVKTSERVTQRGITMGTPVYMSPEQCEGRVLDGRSDLYSLGVVLYEMLIGRPPFEFGSLTQAMSTHVRGMLPPSVRESRPELQEALEQVVFKALAKSPTDRYQSGKEMADALRATYFGLSDTPTRFWHGEKLDEDELVILPAPEGYELVIRTAGVAGFESKLLDKAEFGIGRHEDNELVLPRDGVSRHHARLEHTNAGWIVRALAGPNGTFLNGRRLQSGQAMLIRPGEPMRIGQYELWIDLTDTPIRARPVAQVVEPKMRSSQMRATPRRDHTPSTQPSSGQLPKYELFFDQTDVVAEPGFSADIIVEAHNYTSYDDRIRLNVQGINPSWVVLPSGFQAIKAGKTIEIPLKITPPRETTTEAGRQRFRVDLVSQRDSTMRVGQSINLLVESFESFEVDITPREMVLPAKMRVVLTNRGNVATEYRILAREPEEKIKFEGERGRIVVQAGQTIENELELEIQERRWFGDDMDIPFEIEVSSITGSTQVRGATARQKGSILNTLPWVALTVGVALCGLLSLLTLDRVFTADRGATPTALAVATVDPFATPTLLATITPFVAVSNTTLFTPTLTVAPDGDPNDRDGDGLSNESELEFGSNPDLADTDGDGLLDGAELLKYGSDPTKIDTDGDGLLDGPEVTRWLTNPNSADTDNDGINDAIELENGTNPILANIQATATPLVIVPTEDPALAPTVSPSSTPLIAIVDPTALPTFTPTVGPTAETPTETPVPPAAPTETPVPPAVPTETPLPPVVPTETPVPPVVPTETPTITPTVALLPTETPTITPTVALLPTETPTLTPTVAILPTETPVLLVTNSAALAFQCTSALPIFDGFISSGEYGTRLDAIEIVPNSPPIVRVYAQKDASNFYFAFEVTDSPIDKTDSIDIYVDVNSNGGDPDSSDVRYTAHFDSQKLLVQFGEGSNSDGAGWGGGTFELTGSSLVVVEDSFGWTIESSVALPVGLSGQFNMMMQATLAGDGVGVWPENTVVDTVAGWQLIDNSAICTP
ncbi:MAG: protein kinase domain-containing protein [Candidatus Promineifilaceae bacterium]